MSHVTMPNNTPNPVVGVTLSHYKGYSLSLLQTEINMTQERISSLQKDLDAISNEIARRFVEPLVNQMKVKNARSATIEAPDGFKVKGSVSKTVTWDSDALQKLAAEMDWAKAQHYFKIKFSVAEAMFKSVEPSEFKDKLTSARTTKDGVLKIELIAPKNDEA